MNDQFQIGQINPPGGNVGCDTDPGAAIAHCLQRMGSLILAQLPRQGDDGKAPIIETAGQMIDRRAGSTKNQGILGIKKAQHIDDGVFLVLWRDHQGAIVDVQMLFLFRNNIDPDSIALIALGQCLNGFRHGRGKHQSASVL